MRICLGQITLHVYRCHVMRADYSEIMKRKLRDTVSRDGRSILQYKVSMQNIGG